MNSYERRKDRSPAYWVTEFGVLKEVTYDGGDAPDGLRPLYWRRTRLPKERLQELLDASNGSPLKFARLIEQEHHIGTPEIPG